MTQASEQRAAGRGPDQMGISRRQSEHREDPLTTRRSGAARRAGGCMPSFASLLFQFFKDFFHQVPVLGPDGEVVLLPVVPRVLVGDYLAKEIILRHSKL